MTVTASLIALGDVTIDRTLARPVYIQLVNQIRTLIVERRLHEGLRLPSSRDLADELQLARKTVVSAYDQLIAEGYLAARSGAGTFVEDVSFLGLHQTRQLEVPIAPDRDLNNFGEAQPLSPSTPDMLGFPRIAWSSAATKAQRAIPLSAMFEPSNGGYALLRGALARHLLSMRGITCDPGQIIVTSGLRESFSLVCTGLLQGCRQVAVETPGYQAFPQTLQQYGISPIHTTVDGDGMVIKAALSGEVAPGAVCVSASRQYPTGAALSLSRRAELINWAVRTNGWLIEDDYDCEFRFDGPPLQSMFAMDDRHRTIYFGSLSKTLFPRLRLSFMIAPAPVAALLIEEQNKRGSLASLPAQAALAEFIQNGQYATHIRKMRRLYAERYKTVFRLVEQQLSEWVTPRPCSGGFHFSVYFKPEISSLIDDEVFACRAHEHNLGVTALSSLSAVRSSAARGLLIGFAGTEPDQSVIAVQTLRTLFDKCLSAV